MPEVLDTRVQLTGVMNTPDLVRAINESLRRIAEACTVNYWGSYPQVDAVVLLNTTQIVWIPQESYEIYSISLRTSSGTASLTPRINGVAMTVSGGTPIAVTNTVTQYDVTAGNLVSAQDTVDMVVTGLSAASLCLALGVRRLG